MSKIVDIKAREILDSRGFPTVEVDVLTDGGQLVFLAMEAIRGKPVPARLRAIAAIIGTVMVLGLFIYVIGLDLLRLAGFM